MKNAVKVFLEKKKKEKNKIVNFAVPRKKKK